MRKTERKAIRSILLEIYPEKKNVIKGASDSVLIKYLKTVSCKVSELRGLAGEKPTYNLSLNKSHLNSLVAKELIMKGLELL